MKANLSRYSPPARMVYNTAMVRLSQHEIDVIKSSILELDPKAKIYLFGSRADPDLKGGDIDLLVLSDFLEQVSTVKIKAKIFQTLEEQKIDLLIARDRSDPFVKHAFATGKQL